MKKALLTAIASFTATLVFLTALEKILESDMPEWMRERVNR